jgi:hypothetical protein
MGEKSNAYWLLVGKRPLGRSRHKWVNIRMDLGEVGWDNVDWIGLSQHTNRWLAFVNVVMNLQKLSSVLTAGGLSSSAVLYS